MLVRCLMVNYYVVRVYYRKAHSYTHAHRQISAHTTYAQRIHSWCDSFNKRAISSLIFFSWTCFVYVPDGIAFSTQFRATWQELGTTIAVSLDHSVAALGYPSFECLRTLLEETNEKGNLQNEGVRVWCCACVVWCVCGVVRVHVCVRVVEFISVCMYVRV